MIFRRSTFPQKAAFDDGVADDRFRVEHIARRLQCEGALGLGSFLRDCIGDAIILQIDA